MNNSTKSPQTLAALIVADVLAGVSLEKAMQQMAVQDDARALVKELSYGSLRYYHRINFFLQRLLKQSKRTLDKQIHALLLISIYQLIFLRKPDYAVVNEAVKSCLTLKKIWGKGLVNAVLRSFIRKRSELEEQITHVPEANWSYPKWLLAQLQKDWPDSFEAICVANNHKAPLALRVNAQKMSRNDYLVLLKAQSIDAKPLALSLDGICLFNPLNVTSLPGFKQGWVSVQDEAAQLATQALDLKPGLRVLDACAAPGGKTCHLLEREPSLQVLAVEKSAVRVERIHENLKRTQLAAQVVVADVCDTNAWWDGELFDRILLDAPCSATGVIRRHPDIKLLRRASDMGALAFLQHKLLGALWPLLKKGGRLVYATCSVLNEENEAVIEKFLMEHNDADSIALPDDWGVALKNGRQLFPTIEGHDGFYYCALIKNK